MAVADGWWVLDLGDRGHLSMCHWCGVSLFCLHGPPVAARLIAGLSGQQGQASGPRRPQRAQAGLNRCCAVPSADGGAVAQGSARFLLSVSTLGNLGTYN